MSGLEVITMGCRLNAYESEVMRARARAAGLTEGVIVNTCAVTGEAERQARQAIRRARRRNPDATIIATGCAAQLDPAGYAAMPEVDRVIGNREKLTLEGLAPKAGERVAVGDIMAVRETAGHLVAGYEARARAFVQVQNGCDHRCTFCIIPFARGPSRSVPLGAIAAEVRALVAAGHREVVLSGVDLGHYGTDLPGQPRLGEAVRRLLQAVPELPRLRLSSIDPVEVDPALQRLFADEPRLMPHLHLSVQAGDDLVLKRMKRRHSRADVLALCGRLRALRPGIAFGADSDRGLPDRDAGDVREHAAPDRRRRAGLAPRLPLFAPPRHAGGHACPKCPLPSAAPAPQRCARLRKARAGASWKGASAVRVGSCWRSPRAGATNASPRLRSTVRQASRAPLCRRGSAEWQAIA